MNLRRSSRDEDLESTRPEEFAMHLYCHRKADGRLIVENVAGDRFEFKVLVPRPALCLVAPPHWQDGAIPQDAETLIGLARGAARAVPGTVA